MASESTMVERVSAQRAIEALRNGVPNADAVRALGCEQSRALMAFEKQLQDLEGQAGEAPALVPGTLLAGGFGTGKSHTLAWMEQEALEKNFIVSRVVLSKETPLHATAKVFEAAVREARLPDGRGSLMHELATRMHYRKQRAQTFMDWVTHEQPYGLVAATVDIHDRLNDPEMAEKMEDFWSGEKLAVGEVRAALRELGSAEAFDVKAVRIAELAPIRFEFASRYARACGFAGWVLLLDEAELIARYSLLQRGRAYAELARWLAPAEGFGIPGLGAVAAITDDFGFEMLQERDDRHAVTSRLHAKGDFDSLRKAEKAEVGLDLIDQRAIFIDLPTSDSLAHAHKRISALYKAAYGWTPPRRASNERGSSSDSMRAHVRRWIYEWDLERLYPGVEIGIETTEMPADSYDEDIALSADEGNEE
jgi:hypothetical protein